MGSGNAASPTCCWSGTGSMKGGDEPAGIRHTMLCGLYFPRPARQSKMKIFVSVES
jgi:hypothetical protein